MNATKKETNLELFMKETHWDTWLAAMPEELRSQVKASIKGVDLPAKDHPFFEAMTECFEEYFNENPEPEPTETEPEAEEEAEDEKAPKTVDDNKNEELLKLIMATNDVLSRTGGQIFRANDSLAKQMPTIEKFNGSLDRLAECFKHGNKLQALSFRLPLIIAGCIAVVGTAIGLGWGYSSGSDFANEKAETRYAQIEGVTKQNVQTLKELAKAGVMTTLVPDPADKKYFLQLVGVDELLGQSEIPNGKAIIFKAR